MSFKEHHTLTRTPWPAVVGAFTLVSAVLGGCDKQRLFLGSRQSEQRVGDAAPIVEAGPVPAPLADASLTPADVGVQEPTVPDAAVECLPPPASILPDGGCTPTCSNPTVACSNCIDDDGDGLVDLEDPDCFGGCDGSETQFERFPPACVDDGCVFDANCGSGNDERCDTPPGCDCHGCCAIAGLDAPVLLVAESDAGVASCSAQSLTDPTACPPCEMDPLCAVSCAPGESCFGNRAALAAGLIQCE